MVRNNHKYVHHGTLLGILLTTRKWLPASLDKVQDDDNGREEPLQPMWGIF
jgi:hypothetical protein